MAKKKKTALAAALEKIANKKTAKQSANNKKTNKQKAVQKKQTTQEKPEKKNTISEANKAVKKGQQRSALGTKVEKKTETAKIKDSNGKTKKVNYSYKDMTMQEYTKLATGAQTGRLKETLNSDKTLKKKVTDLNVKDYAKSTGVMGALDQMTQGLSVSDDPTYKYSKSQKEIIEGKKKTGKYNVGRMAGAVAEFGLGGTGTVGSSIAKTAGKTALKEVAEKGGKELAKATAKNIAKETAGDVVASAGLNALDALKFSYKDGKVERNTFVKELALNVGGDILIGGAVSGITHGLSAKQVTNFNRINKKLQNGESVSEAEQKFFDKHKSELADKIKTAQKAEEPKVETEKAVENVEEPNLNEPKQQVKQPINEKLVESDTHTRYNDTNGGALDGNKQIRENNLSNEFGRGTDIQQADNGIPTREADNRPRTAGETGESQLGTAGGFDNKSVLTTEQRTKMNDSGIVDTNLKESDYAIFSAKLDEGKGKNKYGGYVDGQSVEGLQSANAKVFLSDDGSVGVAVKSDGDICGAFNSGGKYKGAVTDMLITARAAGGTKMDCYGKQLVNKYETVGYVPVARIPFNAEYVSDPVLLKNTPDVYVLMKNTDSLDDVISKSANSGYDISTQAELDSLPTYTDYDEALAYRDSLLEKQARDVEIEKKAQENNNGLTFEDYVNNELELNKLKIEYNTLRYKINNTQDPAHYAQYVQRRMEIADILDDLADAKGVKNVAIPTKKTVEDADDLVRVAKGTYAEDVKTLTKGNRRGADNLYRLFVDTFHGFEQYARQLPKEARETFRAQINAARNAKNKAGGWISEARIDANGKKVGDSFNDIIGDMLQPKNAKKYEDFQYYLANKHNIDRYPKGKGVFGDKITADDSRQICELLEKDYPDFKAKQDEIVKYFRDLQQYRVDVGLVSKETAEYLDAVYSNYVPTYRVKDGQRVRIVKDSNSTVEMGDVIKEARGGDDELMPLHEQVANLTEYTLKLGEQNRLFNILATTQGIDVKVLDPSVRLDEAMDACTFTSMETDGATNKFYVAFFDGGQPRKIEISEQMYQGIREWRNDPDSLAATFNWKAKHIRGANALFKNLITGWNPIFGVKNIVKDTGEALIYTKNVKGFIKSYPKAIAAITSKKSKYAKYFDLYQASGGKYAHIREDIATFKTDNTFKTFAKKPIEWCQRFNDCLEAIPRMSEFISTIDNSINAKGDIDKALQNVNADIINKALYNANEVTLNFGRSGVAGKALNSTVIPYLNPAIQGLDKLVRTFRDAGADGAKGFLSLAGKIGAFAVTPAIFNEVAMTLWGGEDYQILNTRDKDNNYFMPLGDGKFVKIPKSRVGAALASPFEHVYRHAVYGDSMEWKQMFLNSWSNVGVMNPVESSLFSPIGLALANKTWYGGSIESASDLDLRATGEKSKIFDETTSAISIWIGEKLNMSPKKIDYIIDAYTGVIGDIVLPATAQASSGNPLYKNFILDSVFSNKLSTEFWEKNSNLEARSNVYGETATAKYEKWKSEYMYDALTINGAIQDIDSDRTLTKKQKLEMKRELRKGLNKYYLAGKNGTAINLEPVSFIAKQIGADKALSKYLPDSKNEKYSFKEHYNTFKTLEGYSDMSDSDKNKVANQFLRTYKLAVETQKQIDVKNHNTPDWTTIALANVLSNTSDNISVSCGVYESTIDDVKTYVKYKGDTKKYIATHKRINNIVESIESKGVDTEGNLYKKYLKSGVSALALATSSAGFKDRAYFITNSDGKMNASRGLTSKYGWKINDVVNIGLSADADGNTYLKKQEVVDAIEDSKAKTTEEKAMLFNIIYGDSGNNPYGAIGDYSLDGDTGIKRTSKSSSASAKKDSKSKDELPSWEDYVKDYISSTAKSTGVKFKDWDSPMDKTYQNKINSILKKMEV